MDERTILICDDDPAIRRLIATILRKDGFRLADAADAPEAIAALASDVPDLVILDVNVPGDGGGMSVLQHIRHTPALSAVRVLLVTGVTEAFVDGWGRSKGADSHLVKPFEIQGLRDAVQAVLA